MTADDRILAVAPVHRGFGYVVMSGTGTLLHWCVREVRVKAEHKNARCVFEVDKIIDVYKPTVLAIEDHHAPGAAKRERVKELLALLEEHAIDCGLGVVKYGPRAIRLSLELSPRATKIKLAAAVSARLRVLTNRTPGDKFCWEAEAYAMPIFVASALALTHLSRAQLAVPSAL